MDSLEVQDFQFYSDVEGKTSIHVVIDKENETVWLTQQLMASIFDVEENTITYHIGNVYSDEELAKEATTRKIRVVRIEGKREVARVLDHYNLDMIISVGYRVNSMQATQFRKWATGVLRKYLTKGFAMDDERLKQGSNLLGKDYFDELLERIREIRASERRFYQKITDIYSQCSVDYDPKSKITQEFYASVQNKLHWAIHHHTAAELIAERVDSSKPNMGMTTWKGAKSGGKIHKSDVSVAKNYLSEEEISALNRAVSMYLDYAENMASRHKRMKMSEWVIKLDSFLQFNEYDILTDAGKVSAKIAKSKAEKEYKKFRVKQDQEFISDFDEVAGLIKESGKLPDENISEPYTDEEKLKEMLDKNPALSHFNARLFKALSHNPKDSKND